MVLLKKTKDAKYELSYHEYQNLLDVRRPLVNYKQEVVS